MKLIKITGFWSKQTTLALALAASFVLLVCIDFAPSSAQTPKLRHVVSMRVSDANQGATVTILADGALNDYEAFRRGDRFQVRLPASELTSSSIVRGNGFDDAQVQRSGDSLLISFKLQAGAMARVDQGSNKLDVVFTALKSATNANSSANSAEMASPFSATRARRIGESGGPSNPPLLSSSVNSVDRTSESLRPSQSGSQSNENDAGNNASSTPSPKIANQASAVTPGTIASGSNSTNADRSSPIPTSPSLDSSVSLPNGGASSVAVPTPVRPFESGSVTIQRWHVFKQWVSANRKGVAAVGTSLLVLLLGGLIFRKRNTQSRWEREKVAHYEPEDAAEMVFAQPIDEEIVRVDPAAKTKSAADEPLTNSAASVNENDSEQPAKAVSAAEPSQVKDASLVEIPFANSPEQFERADSEVKNLLSGPDYNQNLIDSSDSSTRKVIAASLLAALASRNFEQHDYARKAFVDHGYFDETTRDLRTADSSAERTAAARKLGVVRESRASAHLIAALYDTSAEVRRAAVESLGQIGDASALTPLNELLKRENSRQLPEAIIRHAINSITVTEVKRTTAAEKPPVRVASDVPKAIVDQTMGEGADLTSGVALAEPETTTDHVQSNEELKLQLEEEELRQAAADLEHRHQEAESARKLAEEARLKAEQEVQARVQIDEQLRAEEEASLKAERKAQIRAAIEVQLQSRLRAQQEAQAQLEIEAQRRAEEEARSKVEQDAQFRAEIEAEVGAQEEARRHVEQESLGRILEEEERLRTEQEAKAKVEHQARIHAEEEARFRLESETLRRAAEELTRKRAEAEAARKLVEEETRLRTEADTQNKAEATSRLAEEELLRQAVASPEPKDDQELRESVALELQLRAQELSRRISEEGAERRVDEEANRQVEEARKKAERDLLFRSLNDSLRDTQERQRQEEERFQREQQALLEAADEVVQRRRDIEQSKEKAEEERLLLLETQERIRIEEENRRRAAEERERLELEAQKRAEEERQRFEEARKRTIEEQKRREEEARRKAAEEAQLLAEAQERIRHEELAREQAEQQRLQLEQTARVRAEAERRRVEAHRLAIQEHEQMAQAAHLKTEEEVLLLAAAQQRIQEEIEARKQAEAQRQRLEEEVVARAEERKRSEELLRRAEEEQKRIEDEARQAAAGEELRLAELEAARKRVEEQSRQLAEVEQRIRAEIETLQKGEEEQRQRIELETKRRAEAEAKLRDEKARYQAAEEARLQAEREAHLAEAGRAKIELEARRRAEDLARVLAQREARKRADEESRRREEMESRQREEREVRLRLEEETHRRAEEEYRLKFEEEARVRAEAEYRRLADEEAQRKAEQEYRRQAGSAGLSDSDHSAEEESSLQAESASASSYAKQTVENKYVEAVRRDKQSAPVGERSAISGELMNRLKSNSPEERAEALTDLSRFGGDEAFRLIGKAFDDESPVVRDAAARALYNLQPDRAASFTRALREGTPDRRRNIGASLATSGLASDAIANLTGESREKTYDAFSLLFLMAKAGEVQPLMKAIDEYPNVEVRLAVVKLLALSGQPEIVPAFRRLAVRGSLPAEVRSAVMEAIYQISSQTRETAPPSAA